MNTPITSKSEDVIAVIIISLVIVRAEIVFSSNKSEGCVRLAPMEKGRYKQGHSFGKKFLRCVDG